MDTGKSRFVVILAVILCTPALLIAQEGEMRDHAMFVPGDIAWQNAPPSVPPGAEVAVLEGNPSEEGPFTLRLKVPANYSIAPHHHPATEHLTIIEGTFHLGLGETYNPEEAHALSVGSFMIMQPGLRHFAFTRDEPAVIQLHGVGPWEIIYVNPQDDPRQRAEAN